MIGENKLEACLLHNIDIAVISECVCHLKARLSSTIFKYDRNKFS